jgi:hypothetical protein
MDVWLLVALLAFPMLALASTIYDCRIAPLLIPAAEIEAEARTLVERYGNRAVDFALAEARHDLLYCELRRAGRARRVAQACANLPYCNHEESESI